MFTGRFGSDINKIVNRDSGADTLYALTELLKTLNRTEPYESEKPRYGSQVSVKYKKYESIKTKKSISTIFFLLKIKNSQNSQ